MGYEHYWDIDEDEKKLALCRRERYSQICDVFASAATYFS
jgi:hypothetical protein